MYLLIRDQEAFSTAIKQFDKTKPIFVDTETYEDYGKTKPKSGLYGKVRLLQAYQTGWPMALLFDCYFIDLEQILATLVDCRLVFHNASYDLHTINCHTRNLWYPASVDDTFYLSKAKYTDKNKFDFYSCLKWAGHEDDIIRSIDKKENQKYDWGGYLTATALKYAACDVLYLSLLYESIKDAKDDIYLLDIANLKYSINYNRNGLPMNQQTVKEIRMEQTLKLDEAMKKLPSGLNPGSSLQCKKWLELPDTTADTLAHHALRGNEKASWLLKARKAAKIINFCQQYDRPRVYAFHNACGARTSRMTCAGGDRFGYVNLQQPPRALYRAMQASPGNKLVYADFSGLELRMVGAYVGEPQLARLFKEGIDVHTKTGEFLYDCPGNLEERQRWSAKMVSFTTIYGGGAVTVQGIMEKQGGKCVDVREVKELQAKWLELYDYVKAWHKMHGKALQVYGYVDTVSLLGRVMRATTYTESFNFPIQASGAEVLKRSLYHLHQYQDDPHIVNVVHDSITMEHPEGEIADMWGKRLTKCMQQGWEDVVSKSAIPDMPMVIDTVVSDVLGVKDDATEAYDYGVSEI
jgi:DNA polymerase I-like protein with 3'-5' exonuclease and polymerase domains